MEGDTKAPHHHHHHHLVVAAVVAVPGYLSRPCGAKSNWPRMPSGVVSRRRLPSSAAAVTRGSTTPTSFGGHFRIAHVGLTFGQSWPSSANSLASNCPAEGRICRDSLGTVVSVENYRAGRMHALTPSG